MLHIITNREELFHAVLVISHLYKCSHTSCGRSRARNSKVGGTKTSQHQIGAAWDLVPDDKKWNSTIVKIFSSMGCYALDEGHHVHVQLARRFLNAGDWIY